MQQQFQSDDFDLPQEPQSQFSLEQNTIDFKIQQWAMQKAVDETQLQNVFRIFIHTQFVSFQNTKTQQCLTLLFAKLFNAIQNPSDQTILLANMQQMFFSQDHDTITDMHVIYLRSCCESYNYKLGYKFVKSRIVMPTYKQQKIILCEYFFYAGLICQSQKQFEEALNYYNLSNKIPCNSQIKKQAAKMELLLCFRLGKQLKGQSEQELVQIFSKLNSILSSQNEPIQKDEDWLRKDEDFQLCVQEFGQQAKLLATLQKEREVHIKVPMNALLQFDMTKDQLIQYLMEINEIEEILSINEEKDYIEFKNNNLNFKQINKTLEDKLELLKKMINY